MFFRTCEPIACGLGPGWARHLAKRRTIIQGCSLQCPGYHGCNDHGNKRPPSAYIHFQLTIITSLKPHNLYLHSYLVKLRSPANIIHRRTKRHSIIESTEGDAGILKSWLEHRDTEDGYGKLRDTLFLSSIDSAFSLTAAFFVNASILIVAAANFYSKNETDVGDISSAYHLLIKYLGNGSAIVFAVALLCSGQSSTFTGTLAGQVIMEGFLGEGFKLPPWLRRLTTRLLALIPALVTALVLGPSGINYLLVLSQVILSVQLPFAVWPLVYFTSNRKFMNKFVAPSSGASGGGNNACAASSTTSGDGIVNAVVPASLPACNIIHAAAPSHSAPVTPPLLSPPVTPLSPISANLPSFSSSSTTTTNRSNNTLLPLPPHTTTTTHRRSTSSDRNNNNNSTDYCFSEDGIAASERLSNAHSEQPLSGFIEMEFVNSRTLIVLSCIVATLITLLNILLLCIQGIKD